MRTFVLQFISTCSGCFSLEAWEVLPSLCILYCCLNCILTAIAPCFGCIPLTDLFSIQIGFLWLTSLLCLSIFLLPATLGCYADYHSCSNLGIPHVTPDNAYKHTEICAYSSLANFIFYLFLGDSAHLKHRCNEPEVAQRLFFVCCPGTDVKMPPLNFIIPCLGYQLIITEKCKGN